MAKRESIHRDSVQAKFSKLQHTQMRKCDFPHGIDFPKTTMPLALSFSFYFPLFFPTRRGGHREQRWGKKNETALKQGELNEKKGKRRN